MSGIILFDGVCNLCNSAVQFVIKRDRNQYFYFASLQSEIGKRLINQHQLPKDIDSFVLIENNQASIQSTAALKVCKRLDGGWKGLAILLLLPVKIREPLYKVVAMNRYKWFGKKDQCMLPNPNQKARFLS